MTRKLRQSRERGSISAWLAVTTFGVLLMFGLVVDMVGADRARHRVETVANQAARAAGQELENTAAAQGLGVSTNSARATTAGEQHLAIAGVSGTVNIQSGTTIVVTTTDTYSTKVLGIIGVDSVTVTGEGTSRVVRAVDGSEQ